VKTGLTGKNPLMGMPGATIDGGGTSVLEDPTGKRARWLRRGGRVVFLLFLAWLLAIVLGGLGLMPVAGIPLTKTFRPSQGPPVLANVPKPRQPSRADLRPAVPAAVFEAGAPSATRRAGASPGKSATAPGKRKTRPAAAGSRGRSTVAPGHTKTTPRGKSTTAPGKTKTTTTVRTNNGKRTVAPGRTKTTTSAATTTTATPRGQLKKP
jgi:hypothetical protein